MVHLPAYIAKELGYFDEVGLDVEIKSFEGGVGGLRAALAGGVDIAGTSSDPLMAAIGAGAGGRVVDGSKEQLGTRIVHSNVETVLIVTGIPCRGAEKPPLASPMTFACDSRARIAVVFGRDRGDLHLILSSHLLRDVEECCDEVLILKDGNIAAFCNLEEERRANRRFLELETRGGANGCFVEAMEKLGCEAATGAFATPAAGVYLS